MIEFDRSWALSQPTRRAFLQDVARFCEKRERRLAAQEAALSRPSSATNFVRRNRSGCLDFMARREVQLEMQNLRLDRWRGAKLH